MLSDRRIRVGHFGMSNTVGGAETFILGLAEHIDGGRYQMEVITPYSDHALHDRLERAIGEDAIHVVPPVTKPIGYRRGVSRLLAERAYDIVHVHRNSAANIIPITSAAQAPKRPSIVVHAHNTSSGAGAVGRVLHRVNQRRLNAEADCKLACSKVAGEYLYGSDDFTVVPNGIDVDRYRYNEETRHHVRIELGVAEDETLIGNVARAVPEKNQAFLIDLIERLASQWTKCKLVIVGDGPCLVDLKRLAAKKNVEERVVFTGVRSDVCDLMQAMDVFALPSLFEGLPIVLVEAQAAGLPCLVSENVSNEANLTGLLYFLPQGDTAAWLHQLLNSNIATKTRLNYAHKVECSGYGIGGLARTIETIYYETFQHSKDAVRM